MALTEFHDELREVARSALTKQLSWTSMAEMGWLGLEVPEELGGAGASFEEVAIVLHELGRTVASTSFLGSAALAVSALNHVEPGAARDELLRDIADGSTRVAVALATGDTGVVPFRVDGDGLHGEARFVPDAVDADRVLVVALDGETPVLVWSTELAVSEQPVVDATRQLATVVAKRSEISEVLPFTEPALVVQRLYERGALAVACDSLGVAEAMLEATVAYAGVREQFGRPIGSFQAVKHACADMLVAVTVGRELVTTAVREPDSRSVAMAKARVCASAVDVVGKAMQLHGGIGYTWESGIHAYLKRAALNRSLFGSPASHRRRLGEHYS